MKQFYTSYFSKYRGDEGVAISASVPKGFKGQRIIELAPDFSLVQDYKAGRITEKEFACQYLSGLDMVLLMQYIEELPDETVFLCWEKSESFCHRHLLALALSYTKLVEVREWQMESRKYNFIGSEEIRNEVFNTWAKLGTSIYQAEFLTSELKRDMAFHIGYIRGIFQNLQPMSKSQYNDLVKAALYFYDRNDPAFLPLTTASERLIHVIRNYIRKEN